MRAPWRGARELRMLTTLATSAVLNLVLLAGIPFLLYWGYQRWRHRRRLGEIVRRAGLRWGAPRYLGHAAAFAAANVAVLLLLAPPPATFASADSPQRVFVGLGLGGLTVPMALLYGVITTGFCEEFLFRGLIAGSLSRRLSLAWANLWQAAVFLLPHLLILRVRPELWWMLPVIFTVSLLLGWLRIRSGSMFGPWLIHASVNVTTCLYVAVKTAG